jgi:four helix bundle protein
MRKRGRSVAGKNYRDLDTWKKAMDLAEAIYASTKDFPKEETYGLLSQIRRAAVSIPSNIAEGQGRESPKDFLRFLSMARGSLCETETQILLATRLTYLKPESTEKLLNLAGEVGRLLNGLSKSLEQKI